MNITISAPHCTLPRTIGSFAEGRMRRLDRYHARILAADLRFDLDRGFHRVDARLLVAGGPPVVAHGTGDSFRAALDRIGDRLRRQLRLRRERQRRRRPSKPSWLPMGPIDADREEVRSTSFAGAAGDAGDGGRPVDPWLR